MGQCIRRPKRRRSSSSQRDRIGSNDEAIGCNDDLIDEEYRVTSINQKIHQLIIQTLNVIRTIVNKWAL
jgi:hypothetical protein